ncbi:hypothetical protein BD779DRAFT_1472736 [Infundibulicybe gibba]|nr:hypothetical protein BD779DRAFT_1472736 [Infundibulicybe gibba]
MESSNALEPGTLGFPQIGNQVHDPLVILVTTVYDSTVGAASVEPVDVIVPDTPAAEVLYEVESGRGDSDVVISAWLDPEDMEGMIVGGGVPREGEAIEKNWEGGTSVTDAWRELSELFIGRLALGAFVETSTVDNTTLDTGAMLDIAIGIDVCGTGIDVRTGIIVNEFDADDTGISVDEFDADGTGINVGTVDAAEFDWGSDCRMDVTDMLDVCTPDTASALDISIPDVSALDIAALNVVALNITVLDSSTVGNATPDVDDPPNVGSTLVVDGALGCALVVDGVLGSTLVVNGVLGSVNGLLSSVNGVLGSTLFVNSLLGSTIIIDSTPVVGDAPVVGSTPDFDGVGSMRRVVVTVVVVVIVSGSVGGFNPSPGGICSGAGI